MCNIKLLHNYCITILLILMLNDNIIKYNAMLQLIKLLHKIGSNILTSIYGVMLHKCFTECNKIKRVNKKLTPEFYYKYH